MLSCSTEWNHRCCRRCGEFVIDHRGELSLVGVGKERHMSTALRASALIAVGVLALASCEAARHENNDGWEADELGTIPQKHHAAVCSGGRWSCLARIRTDADHVVTPFTT